MTETWLINSLPKGAGGQEPAKVSEERRLLRQISEEEQASAGLGGGRSVPGRENTTCKGRYETPWDTHKVQMAQRGWDEDSTDEAAEGAGAGDREPSSPAGLSS